MSTDDGDFSDPASRAPWAKSGVAAEKARVAVPDGGATRRLDMGSVIGVLIVVGVLGGINAAAFDRWNAAPEVPYESGWAAISIARIAVVAVDLLVVLALLARLGGASAWLRVRWGRRAAGFLLIAALSVAAALEASGELRRAVIQRFGKVPGGLTRMQTFELAKVEWNRKFATFQGPAQPAEFFAGMWRRQGTLGLSDVRRVVLRRDGAGMRIRVWHECQPGAAACDAGDAPAQVRASADGKIESIEAEVPFRDGRIWLRMAAGRHASQPAVIVTQVYFASLPEWQVSSGRDAPLLRQKPAAPIAEFAGDWSRAARGEVDDFTRLAVRPSGARGLTVHAWARCAESPECDLGERPALLELEADGHVLEARVRFERPERILSITLEPPHEGVFEAASEIARYAPVSGQTTRDWRGASQTVSTSGARSVLVRGIAAVPEPPGVPAAVAAPARAPVATTCGDAPTLHEAAALGCEARPRELFQARPAELESRNARGQTALAAAVLKGRIAAARVLLSMGADANAPIRFAAGARPDASGLERAQRPELAEGSTPLIMAQDAAITALLLRFGADTRIKNSYGWSALFYYTHHGSVEMIETLLAGGAAINDTADVDPSHAGSTPLMWAAYMNRTAHLQVLLRHKARVDIRDRAGKTALDYARGFGHQEAIRLLTAAATASR